MKFHLFLIALACSVSCFAIGKKNQVVKNTTDSVPPQQEQVIQINYDSILSVMNLQREQDSTQLATLKDSLQHVMLELDKAKKTLDEREQMLLFDDTCLVALAYRRCKEPYNEKNIKTALGYEGRIFSQQLKKDRSDVFNALRDYKTCYEELIRILSKAQDDINRENPFAAANYRDGYTKDLKMSRYYRNYMEKEVSVRLPILEQMVKDALDRLQKHSAEKPVDFRDLIESK